MASATTCPDCGARVSAYAAGCEACGADLEAHARRRRLEAADEQAARRLAPIDWGGIPLSRWEVVYLVALVFAVIWISALGILLGVLGAMHGFYEGRRWWMASCGGLGAIALALELLRL